MFFGVPEEWLDRIDETDKGLKEGKYRKPEWAVKQIIRETGLLEDICEHGTGHPNEDWMKLHDPNDTQRWGVHGCCGCCMTQEERDKALARRKEVYGED